MEEKQEGFTKDLSITKNQLLQVTKETTEAIQGLKKANEATKNSIVSVAQRLENSEINLDTKIQVVDKKVNAVNSELEAIKDQLAKKDKDLRSFVLARIEMIRGTVAEREALHGYKTDPDLKNIHVIFIGFPTGKSKIPTGDSNADKKLIAGFEKALDIIKSNGLEIIEIHGFASTLGDPNKKPEENTKLNQELSVARAKFSQAWFKEKGLSVPDDKVFDFGGVVKFGEQLDNQTVVIFATKPATPPAKTPPSTKPK